MINARVSVIIPTFNRAQFLPAAVASAQRAGGDPEIIVVDDASTDETPQVCRKFDNVRTLRLTSNLGLGAARNAGIRISNGEYIALLDDDDVRLPDSLPPQMHALEANPDAALCFARVLIGDCKTGASTGEQSPKEVPTGDLFWKLLRGNFIPALSVLIRRGPLLEAGLFNGSLRQVEDWDLWLRLSEHSSFTAIESPVAIYRMFDVGSAQLSSNRARMARAAAAVQARALRLPRARTEPVRAQECREKFLRETRYTLMHETIDALLAGEKKTARAHLLAVLRIMPASFRDETFRTLSRLTIGRKSRDYEKELKAVRKKLWADPPLA